MGRLPDLPSLSGTKGFIDGRSDFYGAAFGLRYLDVFNVQHGWQKTLDKYQIDTIASRHNAR